MYPPLEHVVIIKPAGEHGCRVPFCGHWCGGSDGGLCEFHLHWASRQVGEVCFYPDDMIDPAERQAFYRQHADREEQRIPYHLLMATLWPGRYAEQRYRSRRRDAALLARHSEERDRD